MLIIGCAFSTINEEPDTAIVSDEKKESSSKMKFYVAEVQFSMDGLGRLGWNMWTFAKSAFDKALAEHEDIDDAVGSEEPTERDHGVDLQQPLLIK
ncbi:hypothetical protein OROHE_014461 [Orobanche hederae]